MNPGGVLNYHLDWIKNTRQERP